MNHNTSSNVGYNVSTRIESSTQKSSNLPNFFSSSEKKKESEQSTRKVSKSKSK